MLAASSAHAGVSGRFETLIKQDNRQFQNDSGIEERLDLLYNDSASGLRSGITLTLSQRQGEQKKTLGQFYLEKKLNNKGSLLSLGRLQRSDAFGFYTLDGLLFKQVTHRTILTLYGGVPGRIEEFRSIEGEALYGFDVKIFVPRFTRYALDGRFGWQRLKQHQTVDRLNIGWRGVHQQTPTQLSPSMFSLSGSYLINENVWENVQLSIYRDFKKVKPIENNAPPARLRMDYETYEPGKDELTFKDRFYSLYARGRQSQFKTGYQFRQGDRHTWSINGRRMTREFGGNGYGAVTTMDYHSGIGWQLTTQLDRLALADEHVSRFYFEIQKSLSSRMRGTLSGVLQRQQKRLTGRSHSAGIEMRLERHIKFKILPSPLWLSAQASTIQNSQLVNEYRIAVHLSYHFDDRTREIF